MMFVCRVYGILCFSTVYSARKPYKALSALQWFGSSMRGRVRKFSDRDEQNLDLVFGVFRVLTVRRLVPQSSQLVTFF